MSNVVFESFDFTDGRRQKWRTHRVLQLSLAKESKNSTTICDHILFIRERIFKNPNSKDIILGGKDPIL